MKFVLLLALLASSAALAQQRHVWVLPGATTPSLERVLFDSKTADEQVSCYVFTPESYDTQKEHRFPVLYWLHGSGGSSPGPAAQVAQRYGEAMRVGKIPPMIMVFPNGLPMGKIDFGGTVREACLAYVPDAQIGDYTVIHVGFAISRLSEEEAQATLEILRDMGDMAEEIGPGSSEEL